jgi:hypothetical protein
MEKNKLYIVIGICLVVLSVAIRFTALVWVSRQPRTIDRFAFVYQNGEITIPKTDEVYSMKGIIKVVDISWLEQELGINNSNGIPFD